VRRGDQFIVCIGDVDKGECGVESKKSSTFVLPFHHCKGNAVFLRLPVLQGCWYSVRMTAGFEVAPQEVAPAKLIL